MRSNEWKGAPLILQSNRRSMSRSSGATVFGRFGPWAIATLRRSEIIPHHSVIFYSMVHLRLNEKENGPNPYINFITGLRYDAGYGPSAEDATHLLKALAAQVKPLMKDHGFLVNSLEEVS